MLCAMFCAISFLHGMSIKLPELTCSSKAAKLKRPSAAHFTELDAMPYKGRTEIAESQDKEKCASRTGKQHEYLEPASQCHCAGSINFLIAAVPLNQPALECLLMRLAVARSPMPVRPCAPSAYRLYLTT